MNAEVLIKRLTTLPKFIVLWPSGLFLLNTWPCRDDNGLTGTRHSGPLGLIWELLWHRSNTGGISEPSGKHHSVTSLRPARYNAFSVRVWTICRWSFYLLRLNTFLFLSSKLQLLRLPWVLNVSIFTVSIDTYPPTALEEMEMSWHCKYAAHGLFVGR